MKITEYARYHHKTNMTVFNVIPAFTKAKLHLSSIISSAQPLAGGAYLMGLLSSVVVVVVVVVRQVYVQTCSECLLLENCLLVHSQTWHNDREHNAPEFYGEIFQLFSKFKF